MARFAAQPKHTGVDFRLRMALGTQHRGTRKNPVGMACYAFDFGMSSIQREDHCMVEGDHPVGTIMAADAIYTELGLVFIHEKLVCLCMAAYTRLRIE